jgi:D-lactate dehydrogenase (cytochrome)
MAQSLHDPDAMERAISALMIAFGDRLLRNLAIRAQHGHTTTYLPNQPPDAVVFVRSTDEVQAVVQMCAAHKVPVIPFGAGTSLEGGLNAPLGGIAWICRA